MNRKEIIVFSVFVNMGLLVTLFIFALRPTLKGEMNLESREVVLVNESNANYEIKPSELDQVDQILKEYIAKVDMPVKEQKMEHTPVKEEIVKEVEQGESEKDHSELIEVIVRQGDVLEKIARRHHTTVEEVMAINHMKDSRLRIGQILYLQENTRKKNPVVHTNQTPNKQPTEAYYVVKNGDSPWTIAIKNHIKVADLLRLNSLTEAKAKKIKAGDKLRIR